MIDTMQLDDSHFGKERNARIEIADDLVWDAEMLLERISGHQTMTVDNALMAMLIVELRALRVGEMRAPRYEEPSNETTAK